VETTAEALQNAQTIKPSVLATLPGKRRTSQYKDSRLWHRGGSRGSDSHLQRPQLLLLESCLGPLMAERTVDPLRSISQSIQGRRIDGFLLVHVVSGSLDQGDLRWSGDRSMSSNNAGVARPFCVPSRPLSLALQVVTTAHSPRGCNTMAEGVLTPSLAPWHHFVRDLAPTARQSRRGSDEAKVPDIFRYASRKFGGQNSGFWT